MNNPLKPLEEYFIWYKAKEIAKGTHPVWLYMDGLLKVLPYENRQKYRTIDRQIIG